MKNYILNNILFKKKKNTILKNQINLKRQMAFKAINNIHINKSFYKNF